DESAGRLAADLQLLFLHRVLLLLRLLGLLLLGILFRRLVLFFFPLVFILFRLVLLSLLLLCLGLLFLEGSGPNRRRRKRQQHSQEPYVFHRLSPVASPAGTPGGPPDEVGARRWERSLFAKACVSLPFCPGGGENATQRANSPP